MRLPSTPTGFSTYLPALAADDFYDPVHRDVYDAIVRLHQDRKAIDIVTVSDALKTNDRHDLFAGPAFLATLAVKFRPHPTPATTPTS